jgi:methylmalonyl-CoA mutase
MSNSTQAGKNSAQTDERNWRNLVEQSLRGRAIDTLVAGSDDGFSIGPIHGVAPDVPTIATRSPNQPWSVVQRLEIPDFQQALASLQSDLTGGASGVEIIMAGSASAVRTGFGLEAIDEQLLKTITASENVHLRLDAGEATWLTYKAIRNLRYGQLALSCDSLAQAAARGGFERALAAIEAEIADAAGELDARGQHGTVVEADGRVWAAAGASEAQELAGVLGSLAHHARLLVGAGIATASALGRIGITVEAGPHQLLTVAKLRAARLLHARLVEAFGLAPMKARVHAETSWRMMTRHDVHTNILRATSAAFAAGIGGADSVTVLPFTVALGLPDAFARRVARNLQIILIEEAGLARVADPGAGSGAVETLTTRLAEDAWQKFRAIEAEGGLIAALRSGSFQRGIARMREARAEKIARRESPLTGVSEFPALDDGAVAVLARRSKNHRERGPFFAERIDPLPAMRFAEPFEALRDRAEALAETGTMPKVFLAHLGVVADHADAARAARNFFAIGGIRCIDGAAIDTPEAAADDFAKSGATAACIVGGSHTPPTLAVPIAAALKARGARRVFLMGEAAAGVEVDHVIGEGTDTVAVLNGYLDSLA